MRKLVILLAVLASLAAGSGRDASARGGFDQYIVDAYVHNSGGGPVANASVLSRVTETGQYFQCVTNSSGYCRIYFTEPAHDPAMQQTVSASGCVGNRLWVSGSTTFRSYGIALNFTLGAPTGNYCGGGAPAL